MQDLTRITQYNKKVAQKYKICILSQHFLLLKYYKKRIKFSYISLKSKFNSLTQHDLIGFYEPTPFNESVEVELQFYRATESM